MPGTVNDYSILKVQYSWHSFFCTSLTWRDAARASCGEKDFAVARSGAGAAIACPCQVKGGSIYGQWTTSSLRVGRRAGTHDRVPLGGARRVPNMGRFCEECNPSRENHGGRKKKEASSHARLLFHHPGRIRRWPRTHSATPFIRYRRRHRRDCPTSAYRRLGDRLVYRPR